MHEIKLLFEYIDYLGKKNPLTFKNPKKIIIAKTVDEVLPCLEKVETAIEEGYYAAGFLTYEAAPAFDRAFKVNYHGNMPLLWFGVFDEPVNEPLKGIGAFHVSEWKPSVSVEEYKANIGKIKDYIENGDTYQVNYTIRFDAHFTGNAEVFYKQLAQAQSAGYAAYLNTGDHSILSASPELFFQLNDGKITTRPMKGTVKRGKTAEEDIQLADWLYHSEKNRAENVMIVDLLRNDLGTIAKTGTVEVPQLFTIEQYPTVYQMTSTVTAEVVDKSLVDIFKALFPCGSITGAPKVNTMKIINELETMPRNVYCGTIGYVTPNKEAVFNVPIRTVIIDNKTGDAVYGVGGGVTWDSKADDEYNEVLTKTKLLKELPTSFELLETMRLVNGNYTVYENHFERLRNSAAFFSFHLNEKEIHNQLSTIAKKHSVGNFRVRLLVMKNGMFSIKITPFQIGKGLPLQAVLAKEPIHPDNIFLYHKTTNRTVYQRFQEQHPNAFDVLLWNTNWELTEFTLGNVVVELGGELVTPPIECGLLPGTYRQKLLKEGKIRERKVTVDNLDDCTRIWLINSVREWVEIRLPIDV
ncbi:aminodeoxychorismate synthase component I [Lederbergia sp. NSJ-179]|uniref:aminodeoxychorismate synthase component I n=1 Tax=Lederbergia sp. NSJ-179 TaxID=2931402 RepID=UPI001FD32E92|nr:aminodeoxychorismate synthase component I [Lederbergia sp. NSJ-179]MCJ7841460.1 aminodeoxychorismate synthase component I [Lederbergia sp. NSJ-179]